MPTRSLLPLLPLARTLARFALFTGLALLPTAQAAEPPTAPILRIEPGEHTAPIQRIATDAAGRWLVTASVDKTARVWDLKDGRLVTTLRPPQGAGDEGKLYAVAMSPDGETVAVGGWSQHNNGAMSVASEGFNLLLFDRSSGRLLRRISGLPNVVFHLIYSPDGRTLAASLGSDGIRLFDPANGRLLGEDRDYGGQSYSLHFRADGRRLVTTSLDSQVRLYAWEGKSTSRRLRLLTQRATTSGQHPYAARFSPDGQRIAVGFADTSAVALLGGDSLRPLAAPDTAGVNDSLGCVAWSPDGAWLYAAGMANRNEEVFIRRWPVSGDASDTQIGPPQDWPVAGNAIMGLAPLTAGRLAFGGAGPTWGVLETQGSAQGRRNLHHAPAVADLRAMWIHGRGLTLSADAAQVGFGYEYGGKAPAVFDSARRALLGDAPAGLESPRLSAPGLEVTDWNSTPTPTPKLNGQPLKLDQYETSRSLALRPDQAGESPGFVLGASWSLRHFDRQGREVWQQPVPEVVWAVNVSRDDRWVVAAYGDGTIRWHRMSDGAEQLALYPHPDRKRWVLWTPTGYFDASPGAEDLIGWHVNQGKDREGRFVTGGQLYAALYRPDLITRVLQGEDPRQFAQVDLEKLLASGDAPRISFMAPAAGVSSSRDVTLKYRVCDAGGGIGQRVLRLNGMTVGLAQGDRGLKLQSAAQAETCLEEERLISLQPGENRIAVTAYNRSGQIESRPVELVLSLKGGLAPGGKPTLHVLAVAVDKYRDGDLRLTYPKKDAEGLAAQMRAVGGKLYGQVQVHTLFDDAVRRGGIAAAFDRLAGQVRPEDVFVLYLAGHGVTDRDDGNYYFLPVDFRYTDAGAVKSQALSNAFFQENLAKIRAGKSLVLLDTCNSGSFQAVKTRGVEEKTAMARLVKATGRATLMASASSQVALEGYQGHGVFTWTLLEGLKGKAAGRDRQITVGSLADYVSETLPELTYKQFGYEQVPQRELQGMNFPIGVR